ncbi:hypothetical protein DMP23_02320 [Amycolatopsis sp. A1MSW2902]
MGFGFGQGAFGLPGFLAPVLAAGYAGPLCLEVFDVFRAHRNPPRQTRGTLGTRRGADPQ